MIDQDYSSLNPEQPKDTNTTMKTMHHSPNYMKIVEINILDRFERAATIDLARSVFIAF